MLSASACGRARSRGWGAPARLPILNSFSLTTKHAPSWKKSGGIHTTDFRRFEIVRTRHVRCPKGRERSAFTFSCARVTEDANVGKNITDVRPSNGESDRYFQGRGKAMHGTSPPPRTGSSRPRQPRQGGWPKGGVGGGHLLRGCDLSAASYICFPWGKGGKKNKIEK